MKLSVLLQTIDTEMNVKLLEPVYNLDNFRVCVRVFFFLLFVVFFGFFFETLSFRFVQVIMKGVNILFDPLIVLNMLT
jgi:hypothetical protein